MKGIPLRQLFEKGNPLRYGILVFFILQTAWTLIGIYKSVECSPFYLYGMYSDIYKTKEVQETLLLRIDKQVCNLQKLPYWEKEYIMNVLRYYGAVQNKKIKDPSALIVKASALLPLPASSYFSKSLLNTPEALQQFPCWFKKYIEAVLNKKIKTLQAEVASCNYSGNAVKCTGFKTLFRQ